MGRAPNWKKEELDYLQDSWGTVSIKGIANHLGRSINAVKLKSQRIGLGDPFLHFDGITVNQLALATNTSYSTIKYWINERGFPAKKKLMAIEKRVLIVRYEDFWEWAEDHKRLIDFSRIEPNMLGPESDWVKIKRSADILNRNKPHNEPWSEEDDNTLVKMVNSFSYTYPEISKSLKRTEAAVKRRLWDLNIKAKPVRLDNHIKWTEQEVKQLVDLFDKGYGLETIADRIGKSANGARGKLERMGYRFRKAR